MWKEVRAIYTSCLYGFNKTTRLPFDNMPFVLKELLEEQARGH